MNPIKRALATTFQISGLNAALLGLQKRTRMPYLRAVNYHDVPEALRPAFEEQLRFYAEHFTSVGRDELLAFQAGQWRPEKPGLVLTFDDGLQSHVDVVAPALEAHGMTGWFMVPAAVVRDAPGGRQDAHTVKEATLDFAGLQQLDRNHVVGCHTWTHRRLEASLSEEERAHEIAAAKQQLEDWLGREVDVFAWVGGEEWTYSASAAQSIRDAGFRISFMTNNAVIRPGDDLLQLQRTNVEAHDPPAVARFALSGFFDLTYTGKRRRVNRLTAA